MKLSAPPIYLGSYANVARHNVFLVLNDIALKAGLPQMATDDEYLIELKNDKLPPYDIAQLKPGVLQTLLGTDKVTQAKIIKLLYYHFPFLKTLSYKLYADNPDPLNYYNLLLGMFYALEAYRNFYTHVHHNEVSVSNDIPNWLGEVFDDALSKTQERFKLKEEELVHFRRSVGKKKENRAFDYKFTDNKNKLNEKGLVFFFCLFLENDQVFKLLSQLNGFEHKIAKEICCIYNCVLPQHKLKSDTGNEALLLNILNELQRCPKELYNHLSDDDKAKFVTREETEQEDIPDSILIRKQNRFPYYALRYIEYNNIFTRLLPHLDLGKLVFHRYTKTGPDREPYIRRWEKNIHVFSRLCDIETAYPELLEKLKKDPAFITDETEIPYLVATNPHYNFIDKNIGFKIKNDGPLFEPFRTKVDAKKQTEVSIPVNQQPDIFICTDEFAGMLFYDFLANHYQYEVKAEDIILNYIRNVKRFLNDVAGGKIFPVSDDKIVNQYQELNIGTTALSKKKFKSQYKDRKGLLAGMLEEYDLAPHMVPDRLVKYLMGVENVSAQDKADSALKKLLDETEKMLENAEPDKHDEKNRKKEKQKNRTKHLRAGERATFLAGDMLFFQPHRDKEGKDAPNPDEYKKLQAALAFFSRDKEHIGRVFLMCGLLHSKNPHPFLDTIDLNACKTNLDFYKKYLIARRKYINNYIKKNTDDTTLAINLHFLDIRNEENNLTSIQEYAKRISAQPVNLPRGIFKDASAELIRQLGSPIFQRAIEESKTKPNTVYLLSKYFELFGDGDGCQGFYHFTRQYRVVDEWYDNRNRNSPKEMLNSITPRPKMVNELKVLENEIKLSKRERADGRLYFDVYGKAVLENEKIIRHYMACDLMSFIMCKELIAAGSHDDNVSKNLQGQFFLKDIEPDNEKSILNTFIDYTLPRGSKSITDRLKIRDYGKFRRFLKDRRIENMLDYFKKETITRDELRSQLDLYERRRIDLFEKIFEFETTCGKNDSFKYRITELLALNGFVKHKHLIDKYTEQFPIVSQTIQNLNMIRNKFSHNQFPEYDKMKLPIPPTNFVEYISGYAISLYEDMIKNIQS